MSVLLASLLTHLFSLSTWRLDFICLLPLKESTVLFGADEQPGGRGVCYPNHNPVSLQGYCFPLPHLRQHVDNCAERLSLIPLHLLGTSGFGKRSYKKLRKLFARWWAVFCPFLVMCSYSCWRKRSREALRQHSASALKSFRKGLGCIINLSHLRQGKERKEDIVTSYIKLGMSWIMQRGYNCKYSSSFALGCLLQNGHLLCML